MKRFPTDVGPFGTTFWTASGGLLKAELFTATPNLRRQLICHCFCGQRLVDQLDRCLVVKFLVLGLQVPCEPFGSLDRLGGSVGLV